ncbi:MAG: ribonuclease Y [Calditrichia bacterium]
MNIVFYIVVGIVGMALGLVIGLMSGKKKQKEAENEAREIVEKARKEVKKMERQAYLNAKEKLYNEKSEFLKEKKAAEAESAKVQDQLRRKEKDLRRFHSKIQEREAQVRRREKELISWEQKIAEREKEAEEMNEKALARLEEVSGLNREEAKKALKEGMLNEARAEAAQAIIDIKNEAEERARWEAKEIMAFAIERMATEYTMESTLISVELPNDDWKGIIIGREGRNIKAFEAATGVKVIVDDTPETVVMSSFDPIRREIARLAMERLIKNKNINPKSIEAEVQKATRKVENSIKKAAEETLQELQLKNVHPEMQEYLGRLKYRTSYGQNILQHSKEVAWLAAGMAAELGLDVELAKRAGLFHDIGKAVSGDSEGSHVSIGVELTTRCGEHPVVINSVLAHHEEADPISPISVLVTAADRISGARPGARRESLEAYAQRISKLEELANSFEGVSKTYALSAGREIRVMIIPEKLSDNESKLLAGDIARKIKETMEYPGQIKVTVIRQTVANSYTDDFLPGQSNSKNNHHQAQYAKKN